MAAMVPLESRKIFIHGLEPKLTPDVLKEGFTEFGEVTEVFVAKDDLGMPKKFGFITFDGAAAARTALTAGHHTVQDVKLQIKTATPMNRSSGAMKASSGRGDGALALAPVSLASSFSSPLSGCSTVCAGYPGYGCAYPTAGVPGLEAYAAYGAVYGQPAHGRNAAFGSVHPGIYGAAHATPAAYGFGHTAYVGYGPGAQLAACYAQPASYGPAVAQLMAQPGYAPY